MRTIHLRSLTLLGWRGEQERTTTFSPTETTISGANGLGKSRHFDAFLWLLFGKDSQGRKDESLKSYDASGKTTDKAPCEVSALLEVDGKPLKLRRAFVEEWVKPRGQAEEVFRGHHTECFWDDVPVSVTEYSKRVSALIDETTFKLLTSPTFFASLPWRDQRALLFELAHTPTIEDVAGSSPEWRALLDRLAGKSLADFRRELSARKKRLREELATIQPKIDQLVVLMPAWQDVPPLEHELQQIEEREAEIDQALASHAELLRLRDAQATQLEEKIATLRREQRQILEEEKTRVEELNYQAGAERRDLQRQIQEAEEEQKRLRAEIATLEGRATTATERSQAIATRVNDLRTAWVAEKQTAYQGETTCPHCRQALPAVQIYQAKDIWQRAKQERLQQIADEASRLKDEHAQELAHLQEILPTLEAKRQEERKAEEAERKLRYQYSQLPSATTLRPTPPEQLPAWREKEAEVATLTAQREAKQSDTYTDSTQAYQSERRKLSARRVEIHRLLDTQRQRDDYIQRKEALTQRGSDLSQQIADAEREEYQATSLCLRQVAESEEAVNQLFHGVTFRLFEYTNEDRERAFPVEACVPLADGVPLAVANTARQITAGLEIIRRLAEHRDISAPVFIDNRESIQHLPDSLPAQIINLRVTDETELTITHH